ncbi:MAG: NepR family anti-sigma factor [Mesorhizobium sp.]
MVHDRDGGDGSRSGKGPSADILGVNNEIGRRLRQFYDEVVSEDVPDRFADLLNQLDEAQRSRDGK